jgi:hypothetical protein
MFLRGVIVFTSLCVCVCVRACACARARVCVWGGGVSLDMILSYLLQIFCDISSRDIVRQLLNEKLTSAAAPAGSYKL